MNAKLITFVGLCALVVVIGLPAQVLDGANPKLAELVLTGPDFSQGDLDGLTLRPKGLTLAPEQVTGSYLSPVMDAPLAYNALVPQWLADVPETATLGLSVRTGSSDGRWSDWYQIEANEDWMLPGDTQIIGQMVIVPAADITHDLVQLRLTFSRYEGGPAAVLETVGLTFIDSTGGCDGRRVGCPTDGLGSR